VLAKGLVGALEIVRERELYTCLLAYVERWSARDFQTVRDEEKRDSRVRDCERWMVRDFETVRQRAFLNWLEG
jgi:hypothetical protein